MKPYFSADIETTGDDPSNHQIIEIGLIYEDPSLKLPYEEIPKFNCLVKHDLYIGQPFALSLNKRIFDMLKDESKSPIPIYSQAVAIQEMLKFMQEHSTAPYLMAGKNFAKFDYQFFLNACPEVKTLFHHRMLDAGSYFMDIDEDGWIPSTDEVYRRTGVTPTASHTALGDAWDLIQCFRNV